MTPAIDPEVERSYVFSDRYPERIAIYRTIAESSAQALTTNAVMRDLAYGPHPRERLDYFPGSAEAPLLVFVHGGYWRSQDKQSFSYVAPVFLRQGLSVAVLGYPLACELGLPAVVASVRRGLEWVAGQAGRAGRPLLLCGHSAGAHLAAMAAIPTDGYRPPAALVGTVCLSGIFDLDPLTRSSIGRDIHLDPGASRACSPLAWPAGTGWLLAAVGADETPAFVDQTRRYARHWHAGGGPCEELLLTQVNHYSMLLELNCPASALVQAICRRLRTPGAGS